MGLMRICFIGDSYVNGTGDDACLGWAGRLCAEGRQLGADITLYNLGVRGDTTAEIAERWQRESAMRLAPEHDGRLIFSFGVNDCIATDQGCTRVPEADSIANARSILSSAGAWLPTLMIGPPPTAEPELNRRVEHLSAGLNTLCHDLSVPFLSLWEYLSNNEIWMREVASRDGAHPNSAGYRVLADHVARWSAWRSWMADAVSSKSLNQQAGSRGINDGPSEAAR